MYLLGTRSDETLRRDVFYQARICVHHVTYDDIMDKWSDWSKPSEPFVVVGDAEKEDNISGCGREELFERVTCHAMSSE